MVRLAFRGALGVLTAALAAACLGGQTGQPRSAGCDSAQLSSSAAWGDSTVGAAAETFEGTYEAPLLWHEEPLSAKTHTPVELQDILQLTVVYDRASVTQDCAGQLTVPVTVTLTTRETGISESGDATLQIARSSGSLAGDLSYDSDRVTLDAMLVEVAGRVTLAGEFQSRDQGLPGASASFAVEP